MSLSRRHSWEAGPCVALVLGHIISNMLFFWGTGSCRARNASNLLLKNVMNMCVSSSVGLEADSTDTGKLWTCDPLGFCACPESALSWEDSFFSCAGTQTLDLRCSKLVWFLR